MVDEKKEECGIIGIAHSKDVAQEIFYSLRILQHRGQESAGIAVFHDGIECVKGMGLVSEVFPRGAIEKLNGSIGIGHVRYSTTGTSKSENAQPVAVKTKYGDLAIAHNGDMVNSNELRNELQKKGAAFITETDSEIILRLLANEISTTKNIYKAIRVLVSKIVGSYSLVLLFNDRLFAVRDPLAVRPLCIGSMDDMLVAASESVVPDMLGGKFLRDVEPGEIIELTHEFHSVKLPTPQYGAHCMVEWVYFSRPDSILDGRLVYDVRKRIGEGLAKEHPLEADVVVPIPDSGRSQAEGFSVVSGIPTSEGFVKNRHIERTFIMPNQGERESAVRLKLNPIRDIVVGKRVVLVDDSIVRGTTMRKIIQMVRDVGAEEVHVRIGCPPIIAPCFLGIDMKTRDQFAATGRKVEEIAKLITADSLGYISIDGLVKAIGQSANDLCLGCITAQYPVPIPGERMRFQKKLDAFWKDHVLMGR
jgi:amidophosphoribosyltransferase